MNKKVEYLVGAFLAEFEYVTHEIPVTTIKKRNTKKYSKIERSSSPKLKRKTEHTTKKRNKPDVVEEKS